MSETPTRVLAETVFRRGTAAQWAALNPILLDGQPGWERDSGKFKVGDGVSTWNTLSYYSGTTPPAPPTVEGITRLEVDCTSSDEVVNIATYTNVGVYKKDATVHILTVSDSTPRDVPVSPLTLQGESVRLVLLNGTWYRE